jgi:hypothetical protein
MFMAELSNALSEITPQTIHGSLSDWQKFAARLLE